MLSSRDREARLFRALRRADEARRARREAGEMLEPPEIPETAAVPAAIEGFDLPDVAMAIPAAANEPIRPRLRGRRRSRTLARISAGLVALAALAALVAWQLYPSAREPSGASPHLKLEKRLADPRP
jgi:hypothetical protein